MWYLPSKSVTVPVVVPSMTTDAPGRGSFVSEAVTAPDHAHQSQSGTSVYRNTWDDIINAAEAANDPGYFTAFIG